MKPTEILQALSLEKNKTTSTYCGKLANLFEFLKLVLVSLVRAVISETGLTIDKAGKVLALDVVETNYREHLKYKFMGNDRGYLELVKKESELYSTRSRINEMLWKKRRNKDNSELEAERDAITAELQELDKQKDEMISTEINRLKTVKTDIKTMREALELFEGVKIAIETTAGAYSFYLPIGNKFYYEVCKMLGIAYEVATVTKREAKIQFITHPEILDDIRKAAKFTSKDDLRPTMQCICLSFEGNKVQVVSTDAHILYYSKAVSYEGNGGKFDLLISPESIGKLCKVKPDYKSPLHITVFDDDTAAFGDCEVNILEGAKFPNYKVVIPEYEGYMEFDRAELTKNVKKVMPFANKSTNRVNFHINGSIALNSCDVDFSFETNVDMPYITKGIPDTDIAFNGRYIVDTLGIFRDKTVKMYHDGRATKAGIFTNGIDNVLLMPLMLNR